MEKLVRIVNISAGRLDEQTLDGRSHMMPRVAACRPGCLIICNAERKDGRWSRKDKLTQSCLGTANCIVLFILLDPFPVLSTLSASGGWPIGNTSMALIVLCLPMQVNQGKAVGGDQKFGVFMFLALNLPGPCMLSVPLYQRPQVLSSGLWEFLFSAQGEVYSFSGAAITKYCKWKGFKQQKYIVS